MDLPHTGRIIAVYQTARLPKVFSTLAVFCFEEGGVRENIAHLHSTAQKNLFFNVRRKYK
jgi:hypothetical protein